MAIFTKDDYLNSLNAYKAGNCPNLSGLNKKQLGQLARKIGLDVIPTGVKNRPDGITGKHDYPKRTKTTWKGTAVERENIRNRELNRVMGKRSMDMKRNLGLDILKNIKARAEEDIKDMSKEAKQKLRDAELERVKKEQANMTKADDDDDDEEILDPNFDEEEEVAEISSIITDKLMGLPSKEIKKRRTEFYNKLAKKYLKLDLNLNSQPSKEKMIRQLAEEYGDNRYAEIIDEEIRKFKK